MPDLDLANPDHAEAFRKLNALQEIARVKYPETGRLYDPNGGTCDELDNEAFTFHDDDNMLAVFYKEHAVVSPDYVLDTPAPVSYWKKWIGGS